jgi:TolB-like protein/DNA-binding winged helix-turn-helix (wHTH) protein/Tfp pilus assembly protein PilF
MRGVKHFAYPGSDSVTGSREAPVYVFEGIRLDARHRIVSRTDGEPVALTPKAFDTLLYLIERPGQLVDKRTLLDAVWPGVIVEENNLNQSISTIRRALGETPREHRFIVTVPGRGYRFVAAVESVERASLGEPPAEQPRPTPLAESASLVRPTSMAVRYIAAALGAGLAATLVLLAVSFVLRQTDRPGDRALAATEPVAQGLRADRRSIAVLPFENRSAAAEDAEFFADGIHNDLLVQLAKLSDLKVISRSSVTAYRNTDKSLSEISRELGVDAILEGSVQRAGDAVRMHVQLIDTERDAHLWAESYDLVLTAENMLATQADIATSIARTLHATLSPEEVERLSTVPTRNTRAYDYYLSGNELLFRIGFLRTDATLALEMYERAVAEDPRFALAWANLSLAHSRLYWVNADPTPARLDMALKAAERAFALEPDLPEAHRAMGFYHYYGWRNYDEALRAFAFAQRGMPGDVLVAIGQGGVHEKAGRWEESAASLERAASLDPRNLIIQTSWYDLHIRRRDYGRAEQAIERLLEIAPDAPFAHEHKAIIPVLRDGDVSAFKRLADNPPIALDLVERQRLRFRAAYCAGDFDTQLQLLQDELVDLDLPGPGQPALMYGLLYSLKGEPELAAEHYEVARGQLETLLAAAPDNPNLHISLGEALAGVGEPEGAARAATHAMKLAPPARDVIQSQFVRLGSVFVLTAAGAHDAALEELDSYLSGPGEWSVEGLAIFPRLKPLHYDPRFERLLRRYGRATGASP